MTPLVAIGLLLVAADGPVVDVRVTLDPPVIPFHRQARYIIVVEAPEDLEVQLPDMVSGWPTCGATPNRCAGAGGALRRPTCSTRFSSATTRSSPRR